MAKYSGSGADPYTDPSGVLKNKFGITDQAQLDKVESTFAAIRSAEMQQKPIQGNFDLAHLKETHKRLFGDVYSWAGELRTVDISKGDTRFAHAGVIESAGNQLFRQLAKEKNLQGMGADKFSERLGHYVGEINVLHPFREGNGRTQREFASQLAKENGYHISWDKVSREEMTRASIEAYQSSSDRLGKIIRENLTDLDREKAAGMARTYAGETAQISKAESGKTYQGQIIGVTERYVVQVQGKENVVLHDRKALSGKPESLPGKDVEIRYPHGVAGLVKEVDRAKSGPEVGRNDREAGR